MIKTIRVFPTIYNSYISCLNWEKREKSLKSHSIKLNQENLHQEYLNLWQKNVQIWKKLRGSVRS